MATADAPKYIDLMNWIREQILSGEFSVGMRLPSENELGKKFSISRQTVREDVVAEHMYVLQNQQ